MPGQCRRCGIKESEEDSSWSMPCPFLSCKPTQYPTCLRLIKIESVAQLGLENTTCFENQASINNLYSAFIIYRYFSYNPDVALLFSTGSQFSLSWPGPGQLLAELSFAHNLLLKYQTAYLLPAPVFMNFAFLNVASGPGPVLPSKVRSSPVVDSRALFVP